MAEEKTIMRHDENDHGVWLRCFTAAIEGAAQVGREPAEFVNWCVTIADAALAEERRRRPSEDPSVYESRGILEF